MTATEEYGQVSICRETRTIMRDGNPVDMTTKDFDLAAMLFENLGRIVTRQRLIATIWGESALQRTSRSLDTHIGRIRKKLLLIPEHGWVLRARYKWGYLLEQKQPVKATAMSEPKHLVDLQLAHNINTKIADVAYQWWIAKRPIGWNEQQHLAVPIVNCSSQVERVLALAVADATRRQANHQHQITLAQQITHSRRNAR